MKFKARIDFTPYKFVKKEACQMWAAVVVKGSACLPSTLTNRVQIPLKPAVFSVKFDFEKKENQNKNGRGKEHLIDKFVAIQ